MQAHAQAFADLGATIAIIRILSFLRLCTQSGRREVNLSIDNDATGSLRRSGCWTRPVIYKKFDLPEGDYTVKIQVTGAKSATSTDYYVSVDYFDVFLDAAAPSTPTNLTAAAVSPSQINLSWTGSVDNVRVEGYEVERSPDGTTGWTLIGTSPNTSYSNTSLSSTTTYFYRVRPYDVRGNKGDFSNVAFATTL